jgi:putative NADH-flavin reductase
MKIVILGAAGKTGVHLVKQALGAGHAVTAFVRGTLNFDDPKLTIVTGDARNVDDLAAALKGQDAVVSALGSNKPGDDLIVASTKALLNAMHKTGVKRVLMMSSFLASPGFKPAGLAKIIRPLMRPLVKDKQSGEDLLKQSDLDWTIVYATRLDGVKPGGYRVLGPDESPAVKDAVARADVAEFILGQIDKRNSYRKSLTITAK